MTKEEAWEELKGSIGYLGDGNQPDEITIDGSYTKRQLEAILVLWDELIKGVKE